MMRTTTLALLGLMMTGSAAFAARGTSTQASSQPAGTAANHFASQTDASKACGGSNVVWANTRSKAYHLEGDKYFGHTKHGAWMCMGTAKAEGFHQAGMKSASNSKG